MFQLHAHLRCLLLSFWKRQCTNGWMMELTWLHGVILASWIAVSVCTLSLMLGMFAFVGSYLKGKEWRYRTSPFLWTLHWFLLITALYEMSDNFKRIWTIKKKNTKTKSVLITLLSCFADSRSSQDLLTGWWLVPGWHRLRGLLPGGWRWL